MPWKTPYLLLLFTMQAQYDGNTMSATSWIFWWWNKPAGLLNRGETDTPSVILFNLNKNRFYGTGQGKIELIWFKHLTVGIFYRILQFLFIFSSIRCIETKPFPPNCCFVHVALLVMTQMFRITKFTSLNFQWKKNDLDNALVGKLLDIGL